MSRPGGFPPTAAFVLVASVDEAVVMAGPAGVRGVDERLVGWRETFVDDALMLNVEGRVEGGEGLVTREKVETEKENDEGG